MRVKLVIIKSLKEQYRSIWILLLTIIMAPFFVGVYYLINESSKQQYDIHIINKDLGIRNTPGTDINYGEEIIKLAMKAKEGDSEIPVQIIVSSDQDSSMTALKKKKADVLIIIPESFSDSIQTGILEHRSAPPIIEFTGDMTEFSYIIAAIWSAEVFRQYIENQTGIPSPYLLHETSLGNTTEMNEFDLYMPGLLVLSVIMLMFSASIAFVTEIENGTYLRFRLSGLRTSEFITGVSLVQLSIGVLSLLLTLSTTLILGFHYNGSLLNAMLVIVLVSLSIIGFSVLLAAVTKTSNEILIIGNFPLFLFMFFTGAAFPMESSPWFTLGDYGFNLQGLMSPTHAVSAMKKILLLNAGIKEILPELISLVFLNFVYFSSGIWLFTKRHMRFKA